MAIRMRRGVALSVFAALLWVPSGNGSEPLPELNAAAVIQRIDAAVYTRYEHVLGFTAVEHYAVFRGKDETHPIAEMTVKDTYRKDVGKTYTVISEKGSEFVLKHGLHSLLDSEKTINKPGNVQRSWFNSSNYEMEPKAGVTARLNGEDCLAVAVRARRKASNMINGTIWVDGKDYSLAQIEGDATKSPFVFAGTTRMMRRYVQIDGFSMAAHARAESTSALFGHTVVTIDYSDYHLQLGPVK
jgi:hypothetical protein